MLHTSIHTVPSAAISARVNRTGSSVAGSRLSLDCVVEVTTRGFTNMPTAVWRDQGGDAVVPGGGIVIQTTPGNTMTVATLTFDPVRATHGEIYMCIGELMTPAQPDTPLQDNVMEDLRIQSKCHHNIMHLL